MGRRQGLTDFEVLEALRVLSLSDSHAEAQKSIKALLGWIKGLQTRIDTLERRVARDDKSAMRFGRRADLEAENRTLRLALRNSMSYRGVSLEDATKALVAYSAPTASKAKKDREDG